MEVTAPHSPTELIIPAAEHFRSLGEWATATMIVREGAAKQELASPKGVAGDLEPCKRKTLLGPEALDQVRLPIHQEGLSS